MGFTSLVDNPLDKRHFHGALARHSPFTFAPPAQCRGCGEMISSRCLMLPGDTVCHLCWIKGVRDITKRRRDDGRDDAKVPVV